MYGHRKRVCTESWPWEKNPLPHRGIEPAPVACRSNALPTGPHPRSVSFAQNILISIFTARIKVPSAENQWLSKILSTNAGVGHNIAVCASSILPCMLRLLPRDFFLANFYAPSPFICILSKTSPTFFLCWLCLIHGSCVGPENNIGHPAGCRFPRWVPSECK